MLTVAQRKWIDRADKLGNVRYNGPNGFGRASWARSMERIVSETGLLEATAHGEYTLTAKGEWYKRGATAAQEVWQNMATACSFRWSALVLDWVSRRLGPNVHHPEAVKAGARERWLDLLARRIIAHYGESRSFDCR